MRVIPNFQRLIALLTVTGSCVMAFAQSPDRQAKINLHVKDTPVAISPDLFGIFFEDLNYAADGGLYAELVQNRSFEYTAKDNKAWNPLTEWTLVERGGKGSVSVESENPLNANNPHYALLKVELAGEGVGLSNNGFDGIVLKSGEKYDLSIFAKTFDRSGVALQIKLENDQGEMLAETIINSITPDWTQYTATLQPAADTAHGKIVVLSRSSGSIGIDMVSLFPQKTFHGRKNGLREDLAQVIADLKPKFVRFPGGCLAHGDGLDNMYRWKDTIGPIETRKAQPNIWRYHQTVGLGYFEYFQFCEDIGAKPLPVVAAGVCCQNTGASITGKWGQGQQGLPLEQMPAYIQEVLDLIEYANGPATSVWGAKRAAAGHPEPFNLKYLGVGNEDHITPTFEERFKMLHDAITAKHPEITVIGTVGPFHSGEDFDKGWDIARKLKVQMVDEHYYVPPNWFWENLARYDTYDRKSSKVYLGEYAAHDDKRKTTLRAALAEAAYMTGLERNGDVVLLSSYAPLLGKHKHTQWNPDLIYFDNTTISPTINYQVQKLFGNNSADAMLPLTVQYVDEAKKPKEPSFAASCVKDSKTGDIIVKLVSRAESATKLQVNLPESIAIADKARTTVLSGDPMAENLFGKPAKVEPVTSTLNVSHSFNVELPVHSFMVIRIPNK